MSFKKLAERDLGYIAGLIDGEFHMGMNRAISARALNPTFTTNLEMTMADKRIIDFLFKLFPDTYVVRIKKRPQGTLPVWKISFRHEDRTNLLKIIVPYLVGKQAQAKLCVALEKLKKKYPIQRNPKLNKYGSLSSSFVEQAQQLYTEFRRLQLSKRPNAGKYLRTLKTSPTTRSIESYHKKLTPTQVRAIRTRYAEGNVTHKELAIEFGVSVTTSRLIVVGKRRQNVK